MDISYVLFGLAVIIVVYCLSLIILNLFSSPKDIYESYFIGKFFENGDIYNEHNIKIGFYTLNEIYTSETLYIYRENHEDLFNKFVGKVK